MDSYFVRDERIFVFACSRKGQGFMHEMQQVELLFIMLAMVAILILLWLCPSILSHSFPESFGLLLCWFDERRYGALEDINATDQRGITPLHNACFSSNVEIAQYLVEKGSNMQAKDTKVPRT